MRSHSQVLSSFSVLRPHGDETIVNCFVTGARQNRIHVRSYKFSLGNIMLPADSVHAKHIWTSNGSHRPVTNFSTALSFSQHQNLGRFWHGTTNLIQFPNEITFKVMEALISQPSLRPVTNRDVLYASWASCDAPFCSEPRCDFSFWCFLLST